MADKLKVFISSPGDVGQERVIATRVIERLNGEFSRYFEIIPYLWEHEPLRASSHFQQQIILPAETDIVVFILWSRLGTRLPEHIRRPDGTLYSSGTEYEFENALEAFKVKGLPDLLVYRKVQDPNLSINDESVMLEKLDQKKALDSFIDKWFGSASSGFKAAFHAFNRTDEFENILEEHLRRLIRDKIPEIPVSMPVKRWYQNPFRGLEAFEYEHAPVFFGRTKEIGEIIEKLAPAARNGLPFLIVYGMSGCGKSSLIKAGVIPTLTQPGVVEGIGLWRRASLRPGDSPEALLDGLETALIHNSALPELREVGNRKGGLSRLFRENKDEAVCRIIGALKTASAREKEKYNLSAEPESRLVITVDQLEELFTFDNIISQDRESLIDALSALLHSRRVWIIATMRSDFYHRCAEIPQLVKISENKEYRLLNPEFTEIGQMIRNPAFAAGLSFEINPNTGERLDDVIHGAAAKDTASLPLLEFTLTELFKERVTNNNGEEVLNFKSYNALGGLEGALARRAEEVYNSLGSDVKAVFPAVFRALVTADLHGDNIITNRRVAYDSAASSDKHKKLLDAFIKERLIVSDQDSQGRIVVRIAHEALLNCWPRLKELLNDAVDFLRIRKHITDSAELWQNEGKKKDFLLQQGKPLAEAEDVLKKYRSELSPEVIEYIKASRKKARKSKLLRMAAVAAAFVIVIGFSIITYMQLQEVTKQRGIALQGQVELLIDASENATANGDRIEGMRLGLEAYDKLKSDPAREDLFENVEGALYKTLYKKPYSSFGLLKGHYGAVNFVAYSSDGAYILSHSSDRTAKVWDAKRLVEVNSVEPGWEFIDYACFNNDGSMFMLASMFKNQVLVYETKTGKLVSDISLEVEAAPLYCYFTFLPDNKTIYAFRGAYKQLYDIKSGKLLKDLGVRENGEDNSVVSPDGRFFVSSVTNSELYVGNPETGEEIKTLSDSRYYRNMAFSADSQYFLAYNGPEIRVWKTSDWSEVRYFPSSQDTSLGEVRQVIFSPAGDKLLAAFSNLGVRLFDITTGELKVEVPKAGEVLESAGFSSDGSVFYTNSDTLEIWDTQNGNKLGTLDKGSTYATSVSFSPDDGFVVCGLGNYTAQVFTIKSPASYEEIGFFKGDIVHQVPMPNQKDAAPFILEAYGGGFEVRPDEANDAEPVMFSTDHTYEKDLYMNQYPSFSYSPNGRFVATCYPDGFVEVFDHKQRTSDKITPSMVFTNHLWETINSAYFSFDSKLLVTSSYGGKATIYDLGGKKILHELRGHEGAVLTAEFIGDNSLVYTLGSDGTARVWSVETGKELFSLDSSGAAVTDVGFDPEFENLIMLFEDGHAFKARIFPNADELAEFCRKIAGE